MVASPLGPSVSATGAGASAMVPAATCPSAVGEGASLDGTGGDEGSTSVEAAGDELGVAAVADGVSAALGAGTGDTVGVAVSFDGDLAGDSDGDWLGED